MAYDVTALPAYTKQDAAKLIYQKLYTNGDTIKHMNVQPGIKSSETINIVSVNPIWKAQACSFTASGDTTFSRRTITVGKPMIQMSWCERDLEAKYTQAAMKAGGNYDSLTYNTQIIDLTMDNIAKDLERAIWRGDTASLDQNLLHFDGLVKIISAEASVVNYSGTAWSQANSRTVFTGMINAMDAQVRALAQAKLFCSHTMLQEYRFKLAADNLYHMTGADDKLYVENTKIEIVPCFGLENIKYAFLIEPDNLYFGADLMNEQEKLKVWFSEDNQQLRLHTEFKAGTQIAFPGRITEYYGV